MVLPILHRPIVVKGNPERPIGPTWRPDSGSADPDRLIPTLALKED